MPMPVFDRQGRTPRNQMTRLEDHLRGSRGKEPSDKVLAVNVGTGSKNVAPPQRPHPNPNSHIAPGYPDHRMTGMMQRRTRLIAGR